MCHESESLISRVKGSPLTKNLTKESPLTKTLRELKITLIIRNPLMNLRVKLNFYYKLPFRFKLEGGQLWLILSVCRGNGIEKK